MGASPSSFLRQVDAHPGDTLDDKTVKSFLGPDPESNGWCRQNWALWESLKKDQRGGFPKSKLMLAFGWALDEELDGTMGTREEARAINDAAEAAAVGTPHFYEMNPEEARENRRKAYVHSDKRETFSIPGRGEHDVWHPIRFAKWTPSEEKWPDGPRGIYLLFHGGGWVFGDACGQNDVRLEEMSEELGLVVLVPDYSKAPEHPYPAAVNECELAAIWVEENAEKEFGERAAKMMIIGGESAGVTCAPRCSCGGETRGGDRGRSGTRKGGSRPAAWRAGRSPRSARDSAVGTSTRCPGSWPIWCTGYTT